MIESNFENEIELIKNNVFNSLENAFAAYSISETVLNNEMKANSKILLEKYSQNPDPENWDLNALKAQMPDYEIYIINKNLKIVNTTLKADLGLDFSKYDEFSKLLYSRLESGEFVASKLDIAQNTGLINKYSYQATADKNYILELSIDITKRFPILGDFNVFATAENLNNKYEQLRNINFYKFGEGSERVGLLNSSNPSDLEVVNETTRKMVKEAVNKNQPVNNSIETGDFKITNIYLPFLVSTNLSDFEWWNSFVVRLSYDNQSVLKALEQEKFNFLFNIFLILIFFIIFSLTMIFLVKKTESMAYYDHLTGLLNRKAFERYFNEANKRNLGNKLAILYLDLDGFKEVNDNYGHDTGDCLLRLVSQRLENSIRSNDKVSRIGGDEFTILLTDIESTEDIKKVIDKIDSKIKEPYQINGKTIYISSSIGYSVDYRAQNSFQKMLIEADSEMYKVKNEKNKVE